MSTNINKNIYSPCIVKFLKFTKLSKDIINVTKGFVIFSYWIISNKLHIRQCYLFSDDSGIQGDELLRSAFTPIVVS